MRNFPTQAEEAEALLTDDQLYHVCNVRECPQVGDFCFTWCRKWRYQKYSWVYSPKEGCAECLAAETRGAG